MSLDISKITSPQLLLDENICKRNMERMREKAFRKKVKLYPHFKTHQSREVGKWCLESGIDGIAVSSLKMAKYFADAGDKGRKPSLLQWK
jgi:D-serine deaminase-like pyridoxal phosphate-dependent protein